MWNPLNFPPPGMVTPTVNIEEIEKKIVGLKAVETWLTMNVGFVQMTVKTLEMQKSALESLTASTKPQPGGKPGGDRRIGGRRPGSDVRAPTGRRIFRLNPDAPRRIKCAGSRRTRNRRSSGDGIPGIAIPKEAVMATTIRRTAYFSMQTSNRPGQGAKLLNGLAAHGVNLIAFTGFPNAGRAQVDFVPYDAAKFARAARKLGLKVSKKKTVFVAQGADKPGAIAGICSKLAKARISMVAMDAVAAGAGRYGAMFWVKARDVARAARALRAR